MENKYSIEQSIKKQQEVDYFFEGTIKAKRGHTVYEVNEETLEVKKARYKADTVEFNSFSKKQTPILIVDKECVYIPALNKENALKKYKANKNQHHYYYKEPPMRLTNDFLQ